jgi:putative methyltransferase (TIGR04325 family)
MLTTVKLRAAARALLPPVLLELVGRAGFMRSRWAGDYARWAEAVAASTGYDAAGILERVREASLKVKRGEAAYERDSVVFDEIEYSWPLLTSLMWCAARDHGRLEVLDFGGALGSSYYQNRRFVDALPGSRWNIVEQPSFVATGKTCFEDERLRFFESIEACVADCAPNVVVMSSVLSYLEDPSAWIDRLAAFPYVVIDLTLMGARAQHRLTVQTVPSSIYRACYPCWVFSESLLRAELGRHFEVVESFDCALEPIRVGGDRVRYRGFLLQKRAHA